MLRNLNSFRGFIDLIPVLQIDENDFERNEIHAEVHHMVDDDYMVDSYCLWYGDYCCYQCYMAKISSLRILTV